MYYNVTVIMRQALLYACEKGILTESPFFACVHIDGKPLTERSIADLYRKYCKKLGIVQKSSHKSRKTYISQLIDGGVNLNTIREMVGHADEHTTLGNYCFDRNEDKEKELAIDYALKIKQCNQV